MSDIDLLLKYFPDLSSEQLSKFSALGPLYKYWNEKVNVISRQDIQHLYLRHILHSLAIARFIGFPSDCKVIDVGTGGGFPGIPLAIFFPEVKFTLIDSIGKKIKVVKEIVQEISCLNVEAENIRAENIKSKFDFVISRAVASMPVFIDWVKPIIRLNQQQKPGNGVIALKGGDLTLELSKFSEKANIISISDYFEEDFFASKKIVYLPIK